MGSSDTLNSHVGTAFAVLPVGFVRCLKGTEGCKGARADFRKSLRDAINCLNQSVKRAGRGI